MTKPELLSIIRLLSALESWAFCQQAHLPDYLHDSIQEIQDRIQEEILK